MKKDWNSPTKEEKSEKMKKKSNRNKQLSRWKNSHRLLVKWESRKISRRK